MPATKNPGEGGWKGDDGFGRAVALDFLSVVISSRFPAILLLLLAVAGCSPSGPRALFKGKKYIERGDYTNAVIQLKTATALLATNAQAWNYYGVALQHAGQPADAAMAYQNALRFDRDLVEAHYNLGCLWMEQEKYTDAKTEFTAYTLRRSNRPEGWLKLGLAQLAANDLTLAEKSFSTVLSITVNQPDALNGLGRARVARNRPEDAAKFFSAAVDAHPDFAPARLNLAIVDDEYLNDDKAALENYRVYLALTPRPADWDAVNARVNELEPPPKVAPNPPPPLPPRPVPVVKTNPPVLTARTSEPANAAPTTNSGRIISRPLTPPRQATGRNTNMIVSTIPTNPPKPSPKPSPPVPAFPRYAYLSPSRPAAGDRKAAQGVFVQGHQFEVSQQWADAENSYQMAAQLDPSWFEAQYNYGVLAYRQRDYSRALEADEKALALRPDSADTRYNFALALSHAGYPVDAANELKKILAGGSNEIRVHLALGNLYAQQLRDPAQARQHYERVLALDPINPSAPDIQYWLNSNP